MHPAPFAELPGSVVIDSTIIDAAAHAWDVASGVGHPFDSHPAHIAVPSEVVAVPAPTRRVRPA
jgi:hypothetical protein